MSTSRLGDRIRRAIQDRQTQSKEERPIRLGFVGAGTMGQSAHLRNYAALPGCEVVALAELRPETAWRVAEHYGIPRVYRNHTELLANERVDGLVVAQPFTRHGQLLPDILSAGVPVFCEKPLAASSAVGERIVAAARANNTWVMVGYHKRSDPAAIYARSAIERLKADGSQGALRYVRVTIPPGDWIQNGFFDLINEHDSLPELPEDPIPEYLDETRYHEQVTFVNYYIHQVNLVRYLLGEPYRVSYADPSGILLVGHTVGGTPCLIEMGPYQTTVDWQESALAAFERGYIRLELPAPLAINRPGRVEVLRDHGDGSLPEMISPQLPWVHAMRRQAENFVRAIRGHAPPPCDAEEALEDLRVAEMYLGMLNESRARGNV